MAISVTARFPGSTENHDLTVRFSGAYKVVLLKCCIWFLVFTK